MPFLHVFAVMVDIVVLRVVIAFVVVVLSWGEFLSKQCKNTVEPLYNARFFGSFNKKV